MILRTNNYTYTNEFESIAESPLINGNIVITIGGKQKTQADTQRLKIVSTIRIKESDLEDFNNVVTDFASVLYYTPHRQLYNKTSIAELEVVINGQPEINEYVYRGETVYYITVELREVLT